MTIIEPYIAKTLSERGVRAATQTRYMLSRWDQSVEPAAVDEWRTKLRTAASPATVNRIMTCVRSLLSWASRTRRIVLDEAVLKILTPFRVERHMIELPTQASISNLLRALTDDNKRFASEHRLFVACCLFAGLRPGEVCNLQRSDVHDGYLRVRPGKTGVERHAYYRHSSTLCKLFGSMDKARNPEAALVRKHYVPRFVRTKVDAGWPADDGANVLRKLCASYMACSGRFSEYELMQQLGHTSAVSIRHYRDPRVLSCIHSGDTIEQWMGVGAMAAVLADKTVLK